MPDKKDEVKDLTKFLKTKAKEFKSDWEDVPLWVIDAAIDWKKSKEPSHREQMIENARHYLSDGELSTEEMVEAIENHDDPYDIIDNIEGVVVWEKVESRFTVKDFLRTITP